MIVFGSEKNYNKLITIFAEELQSFYPININIRRFLQKKIKHKNINYQILTIYCEEEEGKLIMTEVIQDLHKIDKDFAKIIYLA